VSIIFWFWKIIIKWPFSFKCDSFDTVAIVTKTFGTLGFGMNCLLSKLKTYFYLKFFFCIDFSIIEFVTRVCFIVTIYLQCVLDNDWSILLTVGIIAVNFLFHTAEYVPYRLLFIIISRYLVPYFMLSESLEGGDSQMFSSIDSVFVTGQNKWWILKNSFIDYFCILLFGCDSIFLLIIIIYFQEIEKSKWWMEMWETSRCFPFVRVWFVFQCGFPMCLTNV